MKLVSNASPVAGLASGPTPRIRPGERPAWIEIPRALATALERRASDANVGVDALAGALVQWRQATREVARCGVDIAEIRAVVDEELGEARLAPTPELRRWEAALSDGHDCPTDLPEICLPARLLLGRRAELCRLLDGSGEDLAAVRAERLAARRGVSIDALVPTLALRLLAGDAR